MLSQLLADHSWIQSALPVLIDAALKGAILVAIAAIAAYLLRNRSAASRHAAWTAAVIGHLAIPVLVLFLPAWTMPVLPAVSWMRAESPAITGVSTRSTTASVSQNDVAKPVVPEPVVGDPISSNANSSGAAVVRQPTAATGATVPAIIPVIAAIWIVGLVLVLLRLAFGTWRVGQLARDGARVEDGVWLSLTQRLANRLGVTRPLILLRGDRLAVPVTWGIVYPAVLLPQDADSWSEERRRFVLVHEMAHVKRFDALTQLLAQISVAVFWFDPLVWLAAHRMRVEREHACDDYVLRDGTTPSLYAGELLEMVRSIGMPNHDRAAPAFAALAMARRSEFEGRMLAILDPRLDRKTLTRRGTFMTAVIVALLTLPLAALRPFQQVDPATAASTATAASPLPESFKVSIGEPATAASQGELVTAASQAGRGTANTIAAQTRWSCEKHPVGTVLHGRSSRVHSETAGDRERFDFLVSEPGRCTEAAIIGNVVFSSDETRIAGLAAGALAWFRERTAAADRTVSVVPIGDGSLSYTATVNGRTVAFDATVQAWLSRLLPEVVREAGINVPDRVARIRGQGGVDAVLREIGRIQSSGSKRSHYEALLKGAPLSTGETERLAQQAARDVTSSGDLSAVIQQLPKSSLRNSQTRQAVAGALSQIKSSGDRTNTLQVLAPNADRELLIMLARAAEDLPSSGDKANFLMATASQYLTPGTESLRDAFFKTTSTLQSSGDMANVLISAIPYSHSSSPVALQVVATSKGLASSGDAANVLLSLISLRAIQPGNTRAALALIDRTLTMASSGDRANVLISLANSNLLSNSELRDAFTKAAMALPSDGDRANVLAAAARR